ncbi:MAG: hypothetical protein HDR77_00155 [Bacteroides sp.]|nr:hypothetical protein [Bacteroides sp.]
MDTTTTVEFDPDFSDRIYGYRILVVEGPLTSTLHSLLKIPNRSAKLRACNAFSSLSRGGDA